ncbi:MAG: glycosyltransferase [Kiritimatiellae bacterium]|nr:glycosyltransferase [Kiritimatiellia bacterium]
MKVSLVTAARNAERTIAATIESALSQKGVDLEYIVIDGASDDGTLDRVREARAAWPDRDFRFLSERDDGFYDAINKGIAMATGDVVGILNADDVFESDDTLAAIAAAFDGDTDAVYADIRFVRGGRSVRYYSGRSWRPWMHAFGHMPPHPSVYIRRELFARLGPYRTDYRISADFELMVRYFCRARIRTKYLPRCVVRMAPGGISTAGLGATLRLNRENVRANRANGYRSCLAMMLPKYLFKVAGVIWPKGRV